MTPPHPVSQWLLLSSVTMTPPLPQYAEIINFIPITRCSPKLYCDWCCAARMWHKRMALWCSVNRQHRVFFIWDHSEFKVWVIVKIVQHHWVLFREHVVEVLEKFYVVWLSKKVFTTNSNGPLSPMMSRPKEGWESQFQFSPTSSQKTPIPCPWGQDMGCFLCL